MKRIKILLLLNFLLIPIYLFAQQPKVYTDDDLENYKSESEADTYRYNKENYKNQGQQEMIENHRIDLERQERINAERQKKIDECVAKAQGMIEESTRAKYRAGANAKLRAGRAMLDSCYGRSSSTSDSTDDSTRPFIPIGGPNFIDSSTGKVRHCPAAVGKPTIDINSDCLPE
jgi:hypothetical protein